MNTISESMQNFFNSISTGLGDWTPKLLGALIALIIGLWLIRLLLKGVGKGFDKKEIDATLQPFLLTLIGFILKAVLFISIAGVVGIPIAAFAALLAAVGLAIGMAFQGSLGHLASGVLLLVFRPFKVGDLIEVDGELGFVKEISVFVTFIETFQNKVAIIPNGTITSGKIINYSQNGNIRADIPFAVRYDADTDKAKKLVMEVLTSSKYVLKDPAPSVYVTELGQHSVSMMALPYTTVEDYWEVFWALREDIKDTLGKNGFEPPFEHRITLSK